MEFNRPQSVLPKPVDKPVINKPASGQNGRSRWLWPVIGVVVVIVVIAVIKFWPRDNSARLSFGANDFQAVFLSNGQVYFGQVSDLEANYVKLENIYYLRLREPLQTQGKISAENEADAKGEPTLVKFGTELHQPKDVMLINRDHILFIEELDPNSKVATAIADNIKKKSGK